MAVSIKVREDTKRRLEHLQADLASKFGRELNLQQLVDALTSVGERNLAGVATVTSRVKLPLSAAARKRILNTVFDWGPTSEADIDQTLYSDEAIHGNPLVRTKKRR